jgi:hypothetical protein
MGLVFAVALPKRWLKICNDDFVQAQLVVLMFMVRENAVMGSTCECSQLHALDCDKGRDDFGIIIIIIEITFYVNF